MADRNHISRLIVWVKPGWFIVTRAEISIIPGVEFAQTHGKAKLVVMLETRDQEQIAERLRAIEALPGVLNVSFVSHHVEKTAKRSSAAARSKPGRPQSLPESFSERASARLISPLKESLPG